MSAGPILLFDGDCAFCAHSVRFILSHERGHRGPRSGPELSARPMARFAARAGAAAQAILARHPHAAAADSLVWVDAAGAIERAAIRYEAVLAIGRHLGGIWAVLAGLGRVVPRPLGDRGYDLVARHRRGLARGDACVVFSAEERSRVLE